MADFILAPTTANINVQSHRNESRIIVTQNKSGNYFINENIKYKIIVIMIIRNLEMIIYFIIANQVVHLITFTMVKTIAISVRTTCLLFKQDFSESISISQGSIKIRTSPFILSSYIANASVTDNCSTYKYIYHEIFYKWFVKYFKSIFKLIIGDHNDAKSIHIVHLKRDFLIIPLIQSVSQFLLLDRLAKWSGSALFLQIQLILDWMA